MIEGEELSERGFVGEGLYEGVTVDKEEELDRTDTGEADEGVTVETREPDEGVTVDPTEAGKDVVDIGGIGGIRVTEDSGGINTAGDFRALFFGVVVFPVELPVRSIKLLSSPLPPRQRSQELGPSPRQVEYEQS